MQHDPEIVRPTADCGRLIVVTSADAGRLDLLLQAVGRRLRHVPRLGFVQPLATQRLPAGGGTQIRRSEFLALETSGALALVWHRHGHSFGHPGNLSARLRSGETIVAGGPVEIEQSVRALWPEVRVIRLDTGTETLRSALSDRACSTHRSPLPQRPARLRQLLSDRVDSELHDGGDLALAVQTLTAMILGHQPPPPVEPAVEIAPCGSTVAGLGGQNTSSRNLLKMKRKAPACVPQSIARRADKPQARVISST